MNSYPSPFDPQREIIDVESRVTHEPVEFDQRWNSSAPPHRYVPNQMPDPRSRWKKTSVGWPVFLLILTILSTYLAAGWQFSVSVMSILLFHEFGHYLQCRRYRVPATLPYFIPMPLTPIGTMGAVIVQQSGVADRKQLFDIAISGPLAGLVIAIPALLWGLNHSTVAPIRLDQIAVHLGEPLLIQWIIHWKFGTIPPGWDTMLHPVAFAGWVGVFITALNLIPVGQLDGGHILYCLLGKPARTIALWLWRGAVVIIAFSGLRGSGDLAGWLVMLLLLGMMGVQHPPTANDNVPLGLTRTVLGWVTLLFIIIGFTPYPIMIDAPQLVWNFMTRSMLA